MNDIEKTLKTANWKYNYQTGSFYKTIGNVEFDIRLTYYKNAYDNYGLPILQFAYSSKGSIERHAIASKGKGGKGHLRCQQNLNWYLKDENLLTALKKYKYKELIL